MPKFIECTESAIIADDANIQIETETPVIDVISTRVQDGSSDLVTNLDGEAKNAATAAVDVVDHKETILSDGHCAIDSGIDNTVAIEPISDIASLDAAVAKLNSEVLSLHEESETKAKLDEITQAADIASLDAAVEKLNSEVLDLLRQTSDEDKSACSGAIPKTRDNKYFDYSLYREASTSPPPHPLTTYRWEDIKREKEKVQRELTVNFNWQI